MQLRILGFTFILIISGSAAVAQDFVPGEVIVKLKGRSSSAGARNFMGKISGKMNLKSSYPGMNMHHFSLKGKSVEASIEELKQDPDVEYAEPNYILRKEEVEKGNQLLSLSDVQAVTASAVSTYSQSSSNTQTSQAWTVMKTLATYTETPIVAIIDTGVAYNHKVFTDTGAMWVNPGEIANNGLDDDGNGYVDDVHGYNFHARVADPMDDDDHGTHVAGIILGVGQDIFSTTIQPAKIRIMALKFLGADGSGSTSNAVAAIYYAVNNGAQVINNSWGGGSYSQALLDALTFAYEHKVLSVAAAGNSAKNNDASAMYPANYAIPGLISIAATTDYDSLASFSNYGKTTVHMGAPGVSILSTVPSLTAPYNSFRYMSGTSMAAPYISGMAALMIREAPKLTGFQVKNLLVNSGVVITSLVTKTTSGGRVDAYEAILKAKAEVSTASYQPAYVAEGSADRTVASSQMKSGGCGSITSVLITGGGAGAGGGETSGLALLVAFSLLPMIVWYSIKKRGGEKSQRKHDRFVMNSDIRVVVGGRELHGAMKTISMGGISFMADEMLEKGGVVTLQIASPDGKEQVQVQGHVVWSDANNAYGVQFDEAKDNALSSIQKWTRGLAKAS